MLGRGRAYARGERGSFCGRTLQFGLVLLLSSIGACGGDGTVGHSRRLLVLRHVCGEKNKAKALLVPSCGLLALGHDLAQLTDTVLGERQPMRQLLALSRVLLLPPFQAHLSLPVEVHRHITRSECLVQLGDEGIPRLGRLCELSG